MLGKGKRGRGGEGLVLAAFRKESFPGPGAKLQLRSGKRGFAFYTAVISLLVFLVSLASFPVCPSLVKAEEKEAQEVSLSFNPADLKAKAGEEFWVSLVVENVRQLAGVGLEIKYNPGVLKCLPVTGEKPLEPGEVFKRSYFPVKNEIDAQNGILRFAALVELPFQDGFSGTGTLIKMKFKAVQPGKTVLSVTSLELEPIKEEDKINGKASEGLIEVISSGEEGTPGVSPGPGQQGPTQPAGPSPGVETPGEPGGGGESPAPTPGEDETDKKTETGGETGTPAPVSFKDLPAGHWAFQEVSTLAEKGVFKGYGDGTFRPQQNISRQEFAVLIERIIRLEGRPVPGDYGLSYKDANQIADWARSSVTATTSMGIFRGDAQGKFNPQNPVSRAEIAVVLVRLLDKEEEATQLQPEEGLFFNDVENHWAKGCILLAKRLQLVSGYADGSFKPQGQASRAEVAAMLTRLLKYRQLI